MFLAFVDFEDPQYEKACYRAVEVLKEVAPKFSHFLGFFYANNTLFKHKKRVLGVNWDELPAMAFNMVDNRVIAYPKGKTISKEVMFDWFDDIVKGRVDPKTTDFSK